MKTCFGTGGIAVLVIGVGTLLGLRPPCVADETHQPVFYEGRIGPYQARVILRPPPVVPGLIDVSVRVLSGDVARVSALPIKWNTGKQGAPRPDEARPVPGEERLFSTRLWFMESGAHGIEVVLDGAAGEGRVLVPVNAAATRVLGMPKSLGALLGGLGLLLGALAVSIAGGAVRESVLAPGETPGRRRRWAARGAVVGTALGLTGSLYGGWTWWKSEAGEYRNNRLYRPRTMDLELANSAAAPRLRLVLDEPNPARMPPLVPDHGRLMHLFLIREPELDALAHLHPAKLDRKTFESELPALPDGEYTAYAQVTHETGFSETLTNRVRLARPGPVAASGSGIDPEDAWHAGPGVKPGIPVALGDALQMTLETDGPLRAGQATSLRFRVLDLAGKPAKLDPYLGMLGHLVVRSRDGRVFTHVHPSGSFSMAAQQLLELREAGQAPRRVAFGADDPVCRLPGVDESVGAWMASLFPVAEGEVSFPYEFTRPGAFRVWVQVRAAGRIRTGTFDLDISARDSEGTR